jgi:hypothetical protein
VNPRAVGAALSVVSLPVFARDAARERDASVFWLLLAAQQLKLVGAVSRYHVVYRTYDGVADAEGYHLRGARRARGDYEGTLNPDFSPLVGSNFIRALTGAVYRVIGPSRTGGFLVFSWLGFWGQYMFHRAFEIAGPRAGAETYSRLVLLWPSLLFWPSSIGKEAWMVLGLGTGSLGAARGLAGRPVRGLDVAGMALAGRVRPHVAALLGAHTAAAYLMSGRRARGTLLGALTGLQAIEAVRYLRKSGVATDEGARATLEQTARRTAKLGGSTFTPPIVSSPAQLPLVPATVLFRPHPLEAHNLASRIAAIEGVLLLGLSVARGRSGLAALLSSRRRPYVGLALAYSAAFCAAFAGIANFGVLARQRVQLLPFYFVLLSVPPRRRRRAFPFRRA